MEKVRALVYVLRNSTVWRCCALRYVCCKHLYTSYTSYISIAGEARFDAGGWIYKRDGKARGLGLMPGRLWALCYGELRDFILCGLIVFYCVCELVGEVLRACRLLSIMVWRHQALAAASLAYCCLWAVNWKLLHCLLSDCVAILNFACCF